MTATRRVFLGLLVAGGFGALNIGGFSVLQGKLGPQRLSAGKIVQALQSLGGKFPGYRSNHAKGVGVYGRFESNGAGEAVSQASVFRKGEYELLGRFSLPGQNPHVADSAAAAKGLALQFSLPEGEQWRTAMVSAPVFHVATPEAFYEYTLANTPDPATGKPDPALLQRFLAAHPESASALAAIKAAPQAPSFLTATYNGLSAYVCDDGRGSSTPVRWKLVPEEAAAPQAGEGPNALFEQLLQRIRSGPARWRLVLVLGEPGDPTHDSTRAWPSGRRELDVGTVVLAEIATARSSAARGVNFDPTVLPRGIGLSDDPIPSARSAVYGVSYRRRAGTAPGPEAGA
ncbi:MAG: catalase family peroxidase [Segniliparus sp.]|uniref:catalase family peroxidase n=1 Tax=Segniliparus sp. TaxID=2804064 RepID=UPI003F2F8D8F